MNIEQRLYKTNITLETRAAETGESITVFEGEGIVFNQPSRPLYDEKRGMFVEIIEPGAIDDDTDKSEVLGVFNHDENRLLGANYSGTLRFNITETGVAVAIDKPNNSVGNDCEEWVRRGDIRGMSFKFVVAKDRWAMVGDTLTRYVSKISKLLDLSLVTRAAYLQTSIGMAAQARSFNPFAIGTEATGEARGYWLGGKDEPVSEGDRAFLSELVGLASKQVEFIAGRIAGIGSPKVRQMAANQLADAIYRQNWLSEIQSELETPEPAEAETPEMDEESEEDGYKPDEPKREAPEAPEVESRTLDWYKAKNRIHQHSLQLN